MPNPTPQSIVEKLSEAQRWALVDLDDSDLSARELQQLHTLGLVTVEDGWRQAATPLGLQLRAILSRKEQNDG